MNSGYILGVSSFYHDSSAALLKNGKVVAAVQEERFSRKKHDNGFPMHAIKYCLDEAGITASQLDYVAYYDKPYLKFERLLWQLVETFPISLPAFIESIPSWVSEKLVVQDFIRKMGYTGEIFYLEHHLSHAASSYLASPFKDAAIITVDGVGEWATTTVGMGKGTEIEILKEIHFPHSLGLLYSAITAYLGFSVNNSEYKVMGLAPCGKPVYKDEFDELIHVFDDGSFELNMKYFDYMGRTRMFNNNLVELFGIPPRIKESEIGQEHKDIAASLQVKTEEVLLHLFNIVQKETGSKNLCLAGGVALNSVANGKILKETKFKELFIQPAAGDAGTSMGAALYLHNNILKNKGRYSMKTALLGPLYSDKTIEQTLNDNGIVYSKFKSVSELTKNTAKLIFDHQIVGWFQGRMEWGPRALGARSILASPCDPEMKDILNQKVKHREMFRPFAPVIPIEDAPNWFECDIPVPVPTDYMLMVYPVKKEKRKLIPAVTHVDGSGRLQTIRREQQPLYYDTIKEFEKLSGVPILVNTSFNIRGEPIVCTPYDAYRCMMGTGIDCLVIGNFLIQRKDNLKDEWDSEKVATD